MILISQSQALHDGVSLSSSSLTIETHVDKKGNFVSMVLPSNPKLFATHCFSLNIQNMKRRSLVTFIIIVLLNIYTHSLKLQYTFLFATPAILSLVCIFPVFVKFLFEKGRTTTRYHCALHQVINAYQSLGRVPTLEEVKKSSRFLRTCELQLFLDQIALFIPLAIVLAFCDISIICIIGMLVFYYICLKQCDRCYRFSKYLQLLFLAKPTDMELKTAIECLSLLLDTLERGYSFEIVNFYKDSSDIL